MDVDKLRAGNVGEWENVLVVGKAFMSDSFHSHTVAGSTTTMIRGVLDIGTSSVVVASECGLHASFSLLQFIDKYLDSPNANPPKDELSRLKAIIAECMELFRHIPPYQLTDARDIVGNLPARIRDYMDMQSKINSDYNDQVNDLRKERDGLHSEIEDCWQAIRKDDLRANAVCKPGELPLEVESIIDQDQMVYHNSISDIQRLRSERDTARDELKTLQAAWDASMNSMNTAHQFEVAATHEVVRDGDKRIKELTKRAELVEYNGAILRGERDGLAQHNVVLSDRLQSAEKRIRETEDYIVDYSSGYWRGNVINCAKALAAADSQYQYLIDNNAIEDTPSAIRDWAAKCKKKIDGIQHIADVSSTSAANHGNFVAKMVEEAQRALAELNDY